jgi:asparagine synthetase B (glutamine-hydrolysing)
MNIFNYNNYTFVHHILHITGEKILQPFINKQNEIICLYNGEIYNYKDFNNDYKSDGECLIPLYLKHGSDYASKLDGEFSIVIMDFKNNLLLLSSDIFGTKPMYYAFEADGRIGIASYKSCLVDIGLQNIEKMSSNFTKVFKINQSFQKIEQKILYKFDINQHKITYDDFMKSLKKSIEKRCKINNKKFYISLSSGYDSGLICGILNELNILYNTIALNNGRENINTINDRVFLNKNGDNHIIHWSKCKYKDKYTSFLKNIVDDNYIPMSPSFASSYICDTANNNNYKIHISGHGVDEIMSDYWGSSNSNFKGIFPQKLESIFPKDSEDISCIWSNFYNKSMALNIQREEFIGGCFGIETRYPFLDKDVIQEFLWLSCELKNKYYKAPLRIYLELLKYPFDKNKKVGYSS